LLSIQHPLWSNMSVIRVPNNKSIELTDLEAHVVLCEQRRESTDERISKLEGKFSQLEEQERISRRLLIGSLITVAGGILTTIITVILRYKFS
jgi:hypothetical protein